MTTDVVNLSRVLAVATWAVFIGFVNDDLNARSMTFTLFSTFFLGEENRLLNQLQINDDELTAIMNS